MSKQVKIIIKYNGKYLLIKRKDKEKKEHIGNWECAGGKLENGESFEDAAIREVKEETNLDVSLIKTVKKIEKDNEIQAMVFLAKPKNTDVKVSKEHSNFGWFSYEELKNLEPITYKKFFLELIDLSQKS
ncbi:MAG: NUDIX hydrolase [bacterium]|nr:NUDIX hydrolase [bacterium]